MLEIKNLTKIYKTKGDVITRALDGVSIKFPDRGMVFLLGKSGSGKSTLLNVCGGLDTPTSGEIIVKGRSSGSFSSGDFDSYRNTFIGFIFQEYNILNEFSVEDNIALALELQGKSKDSKKIHELLQQVELESYAKRKPNTLSGGQKQRIAIARALIKDPEIIMADEPTGALDSNTGKQVLDTLKKLSEKKLVIVVSHDREFAETYGDRIIELKDGKILTDETKEELVARKEGHLTFIDDNTVSIKSGAELSRDDLDALNKFLRNKSNEILISTSEKEIKDYKKQTGISENGARETFVKTKEEKIVMRDYSPEDAKLIKSRLPIKHAARIGISNLKLKPIRLMFTILLSLVSFVLLGVVSTMTFYDKEAVTIESVANYNNKFLPVEKIYYATTDYGDYSYKSDYPTFLSEDDIDKIKGDYGDDTIFYYNFAAVSTRLGEYYYSNSLRISNVLSSNSDYYSTNIIGFGELDASNPLINGKILAGRYPTNTNQLMISSFTYESIAAFGLRTADGKTVIDINSYSDIVGKKLVLENASKEFEICGVYDVDYLIPDSFKSLKNDSDSGMNSYKWEQELAKGIYSLVVVRDGFYKDNKANFTSMRYNNTAYTEATIYLYNSEHINTNSIDVISSNIIYDFNGNILDATTAENDVALSVSMFANMIDERINAYLENSYDEDFRSEWSGEHFESTHTVGISEKLSWIRYNGKPDENGDWQPVSESEAINIWKQVASFLEKYGLLDDITKNISVSQPDRNLDDTVNIVGIIFNDSYYIAFSDDMFDKYYFTSYENNQTIISNYKIDKNATTAGAFVFNNGDKQKLGKLINASYITKADDSSININSSVIDSVDMVNEFVETGKTVFLWVGIVLALFATLLLFNFISVSIVNKQKEIGILRAVGARGTDVFKIFFSESIVIVAICFIASILASIVTCNYINVSMGEGLGGISLLVFGPKSILLIALLSVAVSFLSTFLPVYKIARKKPVESIRAL